METNVGELEPPVNALLYGPASTRINTFSIERLIRMAIRRGLLHDYRMTPQVVELRFNCKIKKLDPEEARLFLIRVIRRYYLRAEFKEV